MSQPAIICVDDQPEVLAAVAKDLEPFASHVDIIECDSAEEALDLLEEFAAHGRSVPLLLVDCVMPGISGVEMLRRVTQDGRFGQTRKVLLTGQASQEDTIAAINQGGIDHYTAKPWQPEQLRDVVRTQLAHWICATGRDPGAYSGLVDPQVVLECQRLQGQDR